MKNFTHELLTKKDFIVVKNKNETSYLNVYGNITIVVISKSYGLEITGFKRENNIVNSLPCYCVPLESCLPEEQNKSLIESKLGATLEKIKGM
jgi:hypothetical protein